MINTYNLLNLLNNVINHEFMNLGTECVSFVIPLQSIKNNDNQ